MPSSGAALLVCNPVGFIGALLLVSASPRPVCFWVEPHISGMPLPGWLPRLVQAIAVAPREQDAAAHQAAFERAAGAAH